jgi:hypothetical protein
MRFSAWNLGLWQMLRQNHDNNVPQINKPFDNRSTRIDYFEIVTGLLLSPPMTA